MKQRNIVIALLIGLLLILAAGAMVGPNTALFKALIVTNDAAIGGDLTTTGTVTGATIDGAVIDATALTIGDWAQIDAQTAVVVGAGGVITPTGTFQPLTSAASVTCSTSKCIANGTTKGDILILANENVTRTVTIDGTGGNVECKTDKALGARDVLTLIWNGTDWNCISLADNS